MIKNCVSIIIPVYNRSKQIENTIISVVNQTYKIFEVIIVDDGSTDDSFAAAQFLLDKYKINGSVEKIINSGPDIARDEGVSHANGEFITFLDSDDTWQPDFLENLIGCFLKYPETKYVFCDFLILDENNGSFYNKKSTLTKFNDLKKIELSESVFQIANNFFHYLLQEQPVFIGTFICRKTLLDEIGLTTKYIKDRIGSLEWEIILRMSRTGNILYYDKPLTNIYKHSGNLSGNFIKQTEGEIFVLNTIKKNYSLSLEDKKIITTELKNRNHSVGYSYFSIYQMKKARRYLLKSLIFGFTLSAVKYILFSIIPVPINKMLVSVRSKL